MSEITEEAAVEIVRNGGTVYVVETAYGEDCFHAYYLRAEEAVQQASSEWDLLSYYDKKSQKIVVAEAALQDGFLDPGWVIAEYPPAPTDTVERVVTLRAAGYSTVVTVSEMADKLGVEVGDQVRIKMSKI